MLNDLLAFIRQQKLIEPGDRIVCAFSGGPDSVALLWALFLLQEQLEITLSAAHFNHHLRGEESDRDETFVRKFCRNYGIPLTVGEAFVTPGKKGLEAAARDARYAFFETLPGKIATAHTADDNAETVLMHLVRGTGLRGLGAIAPQNGRIIRPMLTVTRAGVEAFIREYHLPFMEDSTNGGDDFLRNRLRHRVIPLLKEENPRLCENLSAMALRLRQDEQALEAAADPGAMPDVGTLRNMAPALRARALDRFLKNAGVREPEALHICMAEKLVFSDKPSARASFPGGVTVAREYDRLAVITDRAVPEMQTLSPGETIFWGGWKISCMEATHLLQSGNALTVCPQGQLRVRSRLPGDKIRLPGGSKSLKKCFIDRKIPADRRGMIPVFCDEKGILGAGLVGVHQDRRAESLPAITITITSES